MNMELKAPLRAQKSKLDIVDCDIHPKIALDQLKYAVPWFDTFNTVAVRKAMEDQVQAILSGKTTPADACAASQKAADELLRPYVEQTALKSVG